MSLLDVIGALGVGGSAAGDARTDRLEREARQRQEEETRKERERLRQLGISRQRTYFERLNPQGDPIETPEEPIGSLRGIGPDPDSAEVGIAPPAAPARPSERLAAFDPSTDYETAFEVQRQTKADTDRAEETAANRRIREAAAAEQERLRTQRQATNRTAYEAARRAGAPEAGESYDPDIDYGAVFTRANQEAGARRADASSSRAAAAAERSAAAAERAAATNAASQAAATRRSREAEAATRARGVILQQSITRYPPADQQALRAAHAAVLQAQDDLDPAVVWGIVAQQYETGLLPGQKVRIAPGGSPTAPAGATEVTDPELAAEIRAMRGGRGGQ